MCQIRKSAPSAPSPRSEKRLSPQPFQRTSEGEGTGTVFIGRTAVDESDAGSRPEAFDLYTAHAPDASGRAVARVPALDGETSEEHLRRELEEGSRRRSAYMRLASDLGLVRCGKVRGVWSESLVADCRVSGRGYWTDGCGRGRTPWEGEEALHARLRSEGFSWSQIGMIEMYNDWRAGPFARPELEMRDIVNAKFSGRQVDAVLGSEAWRRGKFYLDGEDVPGREPVLEHLWWARTSAGDTILVSQPDMFPSDARDAAERVAGLWEWESEVFLERSWYNDDPIVVFRGRVG